MADEKPRPWTVGEDGQPQLISVRCTRCGTQTFPAQAYGCLVCGAHGEMLVPAALPARGRLVTFAAVRTHQTRKLPFTLGDVQIEGGPVVRVLLSDDLQPRIGQSLVARVVDDADTEELLFVEEVAK